MDKLFWGYYHSIMFFILAVIWWFSEIVREGDEIRNSLKQPDKKKNKSIGETIMLIIILLAVVFAITYLLIYAISKNQTAAMWFVGIMGLVYAYIAIKQMIKMIFIPENRAFSLSDIKDFLYTYMFWWLMVLVISRSKLGYEILEKIPKDYRELAKVAIFLLWYYFNVLFTLGGVYIVLYHLWKIGKKIGARYKLGTGKIKGIVDRICDLQKRGEKYAGLKSFALWEKKYRKCIGYKILMTVPLFLYDIWKVVFLITKIFIKMVFAGVIVSILDPLRILSRGIKNLWNRHKNNEWMYLFAQIAGICSYVIVFFIIQYDDYGEATKKIYEFAGTIIWIPYFLGKIVRVSKNMKENGSETDLERTVKPTVPNNMVYNEDGEGVIDGKTIRQLEYEAMQNVVESLDSTKIIDDKKLKKELRRIARNGLRKKVGEYIKANIEIFIGGCISMVFCGIYFVFKDSDIAQKISIIGSIIGAEGAMISVLLSIAFMKKSNEKALDASVLPYLTIEKLETLDERAHAFEFIEDTDKRRNFSIWRSFDFNTICNDKIKMVRNGIAYLHIKNIGIGPAIHLKMKIENFSTVYLPSDYLRPDSDMYLILNFNNPSESARTDIIFEYETIRGEKHVQRIHANITWHLDRTNFTLFG